MSDEQQPSGSRPAPNPTIGGADDGRPTVIVSGSLALDLLGAYSGAFEPTGDASRNLSIQLDDYRTSFGGCAMNICYGLALLGLRPIPIVLAGRDYHDGYEAHLRRHGIDDQAIVVDPEHPYGSRCIILSDLAGNQITAFYAGVSANSTQVVTAAGTLADRLDAAWSIIAPDVPANMLRHARSLERAGRNFVTDPGQGVNDLTKAQAAALMAHTRHLVVNDHEWRALLGKLDVSEADLVARLSWVVITRGAAGVVLRHHDGSRQSVAAVPVAKVVEHTGAGDAFRAGLLAGLSHQCSLADSARLGALSAAYKLSNAGSQEHTFTLSEFRRRFQETYDSPCPLDEAAAD